MADIYVERFENTVAAWDEDAYWATSKYFGGTDPVDPNYPYFTHAELLKIVPGNGPNGENVIDWWDNPGSATDDPQVSAFTLDDFGPGVNGRSGYVDGSQGSISVQYRQLAIHAAENSYTPLISIVSVNLSTSSSLYIAASNWDGSRQNAPGRLELFFKRWNNPNVNPIDYVMDFPNDYLNQWKTFRVDWKCGTPTIVSDEIDDVAADGYVKVYIDDVLVYDYTNVDLWLNWGGSTAPKTINGYNRFDITAGLFGEMTNLTFSDGESSAQCENPTVLYSQNWADGVPLFHGDSVYDPIGTADADDPNYPEISYAEGVAINGSGHLDSGHGYNYSLSSIILGDELSLPGAPITATEGYIQARYKPNATSLAAGGGDSDILWIYRDAGASGEPAVTVSRNMPGNTLMFDAWSQNNSVHVSSTPSFTAVAGTEYLFRIEWKIGVDGYIRLKVNDVTLYENLAFSPWFDGDSGNEIRTVLFGGWALFGELWDIEVGTCDAAIAPVIPPMQRAGYVLFSNDIVEKQAQVRFTKTYLMLLAADPPATTAPAGLTLTTINGDLYDQEGVAITSGRLYLTPRGPLTVDGHLIAAKTVTYDITGPLSLNLAASGGVLYDVEYDPDPEDTVTPRNLKSGFFKDVWDIPSSGPVDVSDL